MQDAPGSALDAIERELERLEGRGARAYDTGGCDCVRALLERAEQLGGEVGQRLESRAAAHLDALRARFERDRERVSELLAQAERAQGELPMLRRKLEAGELVAVARALRRRRAVATREPDRRVDGRAGARDAKTSAATRAALERPQDALATRRRRQLAYEDSVAQMVASLALARATDGVPADAGPYNPLRIASQVLDRMREISPFYLTVQLNRLEELASLLNLPELPPPSGKVLPKRPGKAGKR